MKMQPLKIFQALGFIVLIGALLWGFAPFENRLNDLAFRSAEKRTPLHEEKVANSTHSESLNSIAIRSAENEVALSKEKNPNINVSAFEQKIASEQLQSTSADDDLIEQKSDFLLKEQMRRAFRDFWPTLWAFALRPMLLVSFFVSIPVWLFQTIRKNLWRKNAQNSSS
ncbi:MAG: hypothetical protein H6620_09210 [Halobacteriovoraceae bacterium]|nr:hypothetical protein [Halobacteriovoraceae bacterium]